MKVRFVISGRGYSLASGVPEELELPEGSTVDDALSSVSTFLDGEKLPKHCLIAVSGQHIGTFHRHESRVLAEGDELVIIAPVAGG